MLEISDSWSPASSFTAAGSKYSSGDSHPVSVADRCSGDRFFQIGKGQVTIFGHGLLQ